MNELIRRHEELGRELEITKAKIQRLELFLRAEGQRKKGQYKSALLGYRSLAPLCRRANDLSLLIDCLTDQSLVYLELNDHERSRQVSSECAQLCRETGDRQSLARALCRQSSATVRLGDPDAALVIAREAEQICREIGDDWGLAKTLSVLSRILQEQGDSDTALRLADEQIALCRKIGHEEFLELAIRKRELLVELQMLNLQLGH